MVLQGWGELLFLYKQRRNNFVDVKFTKKLTLEKPQDMCTIIDDVSRCCSE